MKYRILIIIAYLVLLAPNHIFPQSATVPDSTKAREFFEKARVLRGEAQHDSARTYFEKARDLYDKIVRARVNHSRFFLCLPYRKRFDFYV